jgi:hypothetical protein
LNVAVATRGANVDAPASGRESIKEDQVVARRIWALSGVAFVIIALGGVVVFGGDTPDTNASAAKVVSYYSEHTTRQSIAAFVLAASVPFLVLFGIYLASFSGRGNDAREAILWRRLLIAGTVIEAAMLLATALIHFALTDAVDQGVTGDAARALNMLDSDSWIAWNSAFGVMMLGAGATVFTSALRRWMGWLAIALGVLLFIPFADFFALLVTLIWIIVASILLYRQGAGDVSAGAATAAPSVRP